MPILPTVVTQTKNLLIYAEGRISKHIRKLIPKKLATKSPQSSQVSPKDGIVGVEPAVQATGVKVEDTAPDSANTPVAGASVTSAPEAVAIEHNLDLKPTELK